MKPFFYFAVAAAMAAVWPAKTSAQAFRSANQLPYLTLASYSSLHADAFSFTGNQATLAKLTESSAGIYGERRFMLAEDNLYCMAAAFKTGAGNIGTQINYAGFADFNEQKIGLAYAKSAGNKLDVGAQFNYYKYSVRGYQTSGAVNIELALMMHLSSSLNAGIQLVNPGGSRAGKDAKERPASMYKIGFGYDVSETFFLTAELVKEEAEPVNFTGGFQYHFQRQFFLRAGFKTDTGSGFAGGGLAWQKFRLDVAVNVHPQLGFSPAILLMYKFKNEQK